MKPEDVAEYLQDHPEFFNEHADLLADIHIPSMHDDRVVSINERQVSSLRERNQSLQDKLLELISFGEENDAISEKMHRLTIALLAVCNLKEFFNALYFSLHEDFAVPLVALRLWSSNNDDNNGENHVEFTSVSKDIQEIAESLSQPYCGSHIADEIRQWFGEGGEHLHSFSMIPLRNTQTVGLLILGSPDPERFYPDMGTLHLKRLGELIYATTARYDFAALMKNEAIENQSPYEPQT